MKIQWLVYFCISASAGATSLEDKSHLQEDLTTRVTTALRTPHEVLDRVPAIFDSYARLIKAVGESPTSAEDRLAVQVADAQLEAVFGAAREASPELQRLDAVREPRLGKYGNAWRALVYGGSAAGAAYATSVLFGQWSTAFDREMFFYGATFASVLPSAILMQVEGARARAIAERKQQRILQFLGCDRELTAPVASVE